MTSHTDVVRGTIGFARRTADEQGTPGETPPGFDHPIIRHEVDVRDARPFADKLSLDREGFRLVKHPAESIREPNPDLLRQKYIDEMTPFIKDYFKASWVTPL